MKQNNLRSSNILTILVMIGNLNCISSVVNSGSKYVSYNEQSSIHTRKESFDEFSSKPINNVNHAVQTIDTDEESSKQPHSRQKRFLGLFNLIQFSNSRCNSTDSDKQGVCYTTTECRERGGNAKGNCASGFGVCCLFEYNCNQQRASADEIVYFQNEEYPQSGESPTLCLFSIPVVDDTICQIRLDFLDFELDGGSADDKPCDRDSMEIFSAGTTELGMNKLCGQNDNQHIYIPVESVQAVPMIRVNTDSRSSSNVTRNYKWNVKITQIDCTSRREEIRNLKAPEGCLQYFQDREGTVSSFNWDGLNSRQYMTNQHYSICFKRSSSNCQVSFRRSGAAPPYSTSVGRASGASKASSGQNNLQTNMNYALDNCGPENGCGAKTCILIRDELAANQGNVGDPDVNDWLLINGAYRNPILLNNNIPSNKYVMGSYFCGAGVGRDDRAQGNNANTQDGLDDGTGIIQHVNGPFVIIFHSDGNPGAIRLDNNQQTGANVNQNARNELGFALDYKITSNCARLDFVTPPAQQ